MRLFLIALAAAALLAACGKKAPLRPPGSDGPGEESSRLVEP